jgi:hypothetical protein
LPNDVAQGALDPRFAFGAIQGIPAAAHKVSGGLYGALSRSTGA